MMSNIYYKNNLLIDLIIKIKVNELKLIKS